MRRYVVVGQRARTARDFTLDDICGAGGRWDLLARTVQASLFISHDIRRDTELVLVLKGQPDPPKALRISGERVRRLNPDERSTVALLSRALELTLPGDGRELESTPGVYVSRRDLGATLDALRSGRLFHLDEEGAVDLDSLSVELGVDDGTFVLGDDRGLDEAELAELRSRGAIGLRLGPLSLHADHCIVIVNNRLDRAKA